MSDLLSAASLFLATLGFVYNSWYAELQAATDLALPKHYDNRARQRSQLRSLLLARAAPLALASAALAAILAPDLIRISWSSARAFLAIGDATSYRYDPVATLFCAVALFATFFAIHTIGLVLRVNRRRAKAVQKAYLP